MTLFFLKETDPCPYMEAAQSTLKRMLYVNVLKLLMYLSMN